MKLLSFHVDVANVSTIGCVRLLSSLNESSDMKHYQEDNRLSWSGGAFWSLASIWGPKETNNNCGHPNISERYFH